MTAEPGSAPGWEDLFQILCDEGRDAEALAALLERFRAETGARRAALYLDEDAALRLEVAVGEGGFPELAPAPTPEGLGSLGVPGGLVLFAPEEALAEPAASPLPALLALAARLVLARRQLKRHHFQASFRGVEREALYDVGLAITSTLNLDALSEAILTWALALLDARRAALYLVDGEQYRLSRALGGDARDRFTAAQGEADLPADLLPGAAYLLSAAIEIEGSPRGLLVVADKESRHGVGPFGDADRRTLQLFANQAAIALENAHLHRQALEKERLEREMELAAEIQRQILPKAMPELPGYELWGWNRPARQVGGDYYDLLPTGSGRLVVTVGDVSGKGMPAALMVSVLHSALRLMLDRQELCPALMAQLNRHVRDSSTPNKFITLLSAELEPAGHRLTYLNAGHNPGLVVGADGTVRQLPASGLPLGLFPGASYQPGSVDLGPGDLVCLYSDGITEATDREGEEFGAGRLADLLRSRLGEPLPEVVRALDAAVSAHAQGQPQGDDQTVVLIRRVAGG